VDIRVQNNNFAELDGACGACTGTQARWGVGREAELAGAWASPASPAVVTPSRCGLLSSARSGIVNDFGPMTRTGCWPRRSGTNGRDGGALATPTGSVRVPNTPWL